MLKLIDVYRTIPLIIAILGFCLMSWLYMNKSVTRVVIISVEENTTRLLSDHSAKIDERINFLREWVSFYFNYDNKNMSSQIDQGVKFLSPRLWKNQEAKKYEKLIKLSEKHNISEESVLEEIDFNEDKELWILSLSTTFTQDGRKIEEQSKVSVKLKDVERTQIDRWGVQIDELSKSI